MALLTFRWASLDISVRFPQGPDGITGWILSFVLLLFLFPRSEVPMPISGDAAGSHSAADANAKSLEVKKLRPSPRLFYIDNLRIFVTQLVVTFHITYSWVGSGELDGFEVGNYPNPFYPVAKAFFLDPCYGFFMCLLFFISGLVTPGSLKRKGMSDFVYERCMRLGLPFLVTYW